MSQVPWGECFPTFRSMQIPSPSGSMSASTESDTILQNVRKYSPNATGSYPKTLYSSKSYILPILSTPLFLNCLWRRRTLLLEVVKLMMLVRSELQHEGFPVISLRIEGTSCAEITRQDLLSCGVFNVNCNEVWLRMSTADIQAE